MYVRNGVHKKKCSLGMAQRSNLKKVLAILRLLLRRGQHCVVVNLLGHICAYQLQEPPGWKSGHKNKNYEAWRGGRITRYKVHLNQLNRLKVVWGKMHHLKSQPIFSEASQMEWLEPFDFPTGISGFPMYLVSLLLNLVIAVKEATASPKPVSNFKKSPTHSYRVSLDVK